MIINHNITALNTHRQLSSATSAQSKSMEKLASGMRINKAGDDAAGLAISEKMRGQIRGLDQAGKNAQDGISLISTAEGALNETHAILQRMRELATQSANDTNVIDDRESIQKEMDQLTQEINRISDTTQFNTQDLLKGSFTAKLQIGANEDQNLTINVRDMSATGSVLNLGTASGAAAVTEASVVKVANGAESPLTLTAVADDINVTGYTGDKNLEISVKALSVGDATGTKGTFEVTVNGKTTIVNGDDDTEQTGITITTDSGNITITNAGEDWTATDEFKFTVKGANSDVTGPDVSTHDNAKLAITAIDNAIKEVSAERSTLGAWQNRLDHTINNLGTSSENLTAAESRIRDVDMAKEMMEQTKNSILSQAAQAMLAQANQQPQGVLQLLR